MKYSRCKWEFQRLSNTQPTNNNRSKRKWDPKLVSWTRDHSGTETNNMLIHRNILLIEMEFRTLHTIRAKIVQFTGFVDCVQ